MSQDRKNAVVDKLYKGLAGLLKGRKVTTFSGTGTLEADHRVEVVDGEDAGRVVVGRNVVLAAGSVPPSLPGFEVDGRLIMTSDEFLDLKELPASVVVIGGGVVGCEFASLLADLGSKVTILEALDTILPAATRTSSACSSAPSRSAASTSSPASRSRATRRRRTGR